MRSLRNRSAGFTIIELLIVIVVIGILAGLVLNAFGNIQERARDTERQNDINTIHTQLELYYTENSKYPASLNDLPDLNAAAEEAPNDGEAYVFEPTRDNGTSCTTAGDNSSACVEYNLNATLEDDDSIFERDSLNGTPDSDS